jgi:hypothetical protein
MMEYLAGNKSYLKYFSPSSQLKTAILNLMELYFHILHDADEEIAEKTFSEFKQYIVSFSDEDVKNGMKFKLRSKSKRLDISYADAIGYVMSERLKTRFLTGDNVFRTLPNVEFVK